MERYESIPVNEQETTISFWRDEDHASVWTNDRTTITKLDKLCREAPENYQCIEVGKARIGGGILDKRYKISDKDFIRFIPRKRKTAPIPDDQKAEYAKRFKRA